MRKLLTTIKIYDSSQADLGLETKETTVPFILDLDDISAVRPMVEEGAIDPAGSAIYLKSGDSFCIGTPYDTLKKLIPGDYAKP